MRIVQLSRDYPPVPSGIGDHVARVSAELARAGDHVVVVCAREVPAPPTGSAVEVRPLIARWDAGAFAGIAHVVRAAQPDVIVWHYNPFQIGRRGIALRAGFLARSLAGVAPLVVIAHELWYPWGRSGFRGLVWAAAQRRQLRGVVKAARRIVVTTDARRQELSQRFRKRAADISVVAAGATIEPSTSPPDRFGIPASTFVIAHIGAIGEGRDLTPAFAALDALEAEGIDTRLLLLGRTGIDPPNHSRVVATGPLPHEALSGVLSAADAYLFAEPTGPVARKTSLLSALAHGLPVIAYTGPAAEPVFRDGVNVLLVKPSGDAVTEAMRKLATDAALRVRIGEAGKRLAAERFSWQAIAAGIRAAAAAAINR